MRKLILFSSIGILCLVGEVQAQLQKGTRYWGATISSNGEASNQKYYADYKSNAKYANIYPSLRTGWFFRDNTMFGVDLSPSISFSRSKNNLSGTESKYEYNGIAVNLTPYIRKYKSLSPKWLLYVHSGVNLSYVRTKNTNSDESEFKNGYGAGLNIVPGVAFRLTPRFWLESDVSVFNLNLSYVNFNDNNSVNFQTGLRSDIQQYFTVRAAWYIQKSN
ncbi:outer membrane beta-barrel protein [Dyadobacter psychrophilus]|uniref:Outer membrane protein beta-barrel domain-containing protein n=1 Tax=Dyadobacter psychrophilus TaxID=651661 RepID=A0A1T5C9G7_9BACT|nr:outer membrane beta-barrel protein [Dyadobacter psychrophilus]SKB56098.1 Outer membrane protein beta-barrel domain-containing protein [Dyadobacter psychrophilus]